MSIPPAFALALAMTLLSVFVYHTAFGRDARGLALSVPAALIGLVLGETVARWLGHAGPAVGSVHILHDLAGIWLCLALVARRVA